MKRFIQHEPLVVQSTETDQWAFPVHTHNHLEIILIRRGSGQHFINGNQFAYREGDLFFLGPLDNHYFSIEKKTQFSCLSFTELYMAGLTATGANTWPQINDHCQRVAQPLRGSIVTDRTEQQSLQALADIILLEQTNHCPLFSNPVVDSLMRTILSLVDRQLARYPLRSTAVASSPSTLTQRIAAYVSQHITKPESLRLENLADVFHYSPSHLGALFKQQAGESIQQYIIRYKLRLVETRLGHDTMSISQIADEFGFTDVCHLNKLFKQYYHQTPTNYRHQLAISLNTHRCSLPVV